MEIWMNPSCSKCRAAKQDLDAAGVAYSERRYLDHPPTTDELNDVLARLGLEPWDIAREKEAREAGIDHPKDLAHRDAWITSLIEHPRTIQRPIITADDGTAYVARDPETVQKVIARRQ